MATLLSRMVNKQQVLQGKRTLSKATVGVALYTAGLAAAIRAFGTSTDHSIAFMTATQRPTMDTNGRVDITGSLYVNGTPKIGTSELIETLSTLRASTQDETECPSGACLPVTSSLRSSKQCNQPQLRR